MKKRAIITVVLATVAAGTFYHTPVRNDRKDPRSTQPAVAKVACSAGALNPQSEIAQSLQEVFPEMDVPVEDWSNWTPPRITVSPFPETPIPFALTRLNRGVDKNGERYTTWVGRPANDVTHNAAGWHLVGVGTSHGWQGITPAASTPRSVIGRRSTSNPSATSHIKSAQPRGRKIGAIPD